MFKEILQIIPKLAPNDLNNMERSLTTRFGRIAKKFGKGLGASILGGGFLGAAVGIIDKILNPLKETQEAIDRTLKASDDVVTNAKQFGTTAGKLFRLQQIGKATGLDEGSLDLLLQKFQTAVAEAQADPSKPSAVREFVGDKDTASSFFQFIQALQKMEKNQQVLVQQEVFGEKQILKMADFLQTDFGALTKRLGGPTSAQLTPGLEKLGGLNDEKDLLEARRTLNDTLAKSRVINQGMIEAQDEAARRELQKENMQIKSYSDLAAISAASTEILNVAKEALLGVTALVVKATDLVNTVKKMSDSNIMRGLIKYFGGK